MDNRFTLESLLRAEGVLSAVDLGRRLQVSPATLSRLVAAARGRVVRLGRARASRYGLVRSLSGLPAKLPVYRIGVDGSAARVATLIPLVGGSTWLEPMNEQGSLFAGLPPVVVDMAPAGYLGRRFSRRHPELELPPHLQDWSDDHRLRALGLAGDDVPGDLVLGDVSMDRALAALAVEVDLEAYPALSVESSTGGAGSSAAGEHPKFAAVRNGRRVLVKFTSGDGSPLDERWRDLLVCESIALALLREHGVAAAAAAVVDVGTQRFLEVERFDRVGLRGRRGVLSLGPLDDDLFGSRDSWTQAATRLAEARLLSARDARRIRLLDAFGLAIENGDRHFGNISFFADGLAARPRLLLAPAYDMLPMNLAPHGGHIPHFPERTASPSARMLEVWEEASMLAAGYWERVASDERITAAFRAGVRRTWMR